MEPAVEPFRALVGETEIGAPNVPVNSCVTAEPFDDIPARLVEAITRPVRWLDVMRSLERAGVRRFVETGPGKVLTNLIRKSLDGVEAEAPLSERIAPARASPRPRARPRPRRPHMPDGRFSHGAVATRAPARPRELRAASLASITRALPANIVGNDVVAAAAGVTAQWIAHRTGVHERRNVSAGETVVTLGAEAGRMALEEAGVDAADLDLVLLATVAPDEILPNAAPLVATELGAVRAGAMDLGAACTGFLSALSMATAQVEGGRADYVLVIGADVLSRFVDSSDRGTAALFADGAGAAVVGPANGAGGWIGDIVLACDGVGGPAIRASHEEQLIRMQGHDTFKAAVLHMSEATLRRSSAPALGSTTSTCSSTTRPTSASCGRSPNGSASTSHA